MTTQEPPSWERVDALRREADHARRHDQLRMALVCEAQARDMQAQLLERARALRAPSKRGHLAVALLLLFAGAFGLVYAILRLRGGR